MVLRATVGKFAAAFRRLYSPNSVIQIGNMPARTQRLRFRGMASTSSNGTNSAMASDMSHTRSQSEEEEDDNELPVRHKRYYDIAMAPGQILQYCTCGLTIWEPVCDRSHAFEMAKGKYFPINFRAPEPDGQTGTRGDVRGQRRRAAAREGKGNAPGERNTVSTGSNSDTSGTADSNADIQQITYRFCGCRDSAELPLCDGSQLWCTSDPT